jgi:hypothetical protein
MLLLLLTAAAGAAGVTHGVPLVTPGDAAAAAAVDALVLHGILARGKRLHTVHLLLLLLVGVAGRGTAAAAAACRSTRSGNTSRPHRRRQLTVDRPRHISMTHR